MAPRAHWAKRTEFAEVAESLAIPSDLVIAAMGAQGVTYVFFSLTDEGEWWSAVLYRDDDGILRERSRREETGMRRRALKEIGSELGDVE
jgi:hypothetical protein